MNGSINKWQEPWGEACDAYEAEVEIARLRAILDMGKAYPYLPSNLAKKIEEMEKQ